MIVFIIALLFIAIFFILLAIFVNISNNYDSFCVFYNDLNIFKNNKYTYNYLKKSNISSKIYQSEIINRKPFVYEHCFINNYKYLLSLSKYVDRKINSCKLKFRSVKTKILIDEIATYLTKKLITTNASNIFKNYKSFINKYKIKQKENKIFKLLLAQKLLSLITIIENEFEKFFYIINKSKNINKFINYKYKLYNSAEIYGTATLNKNSTKLLYLNDNYKSSIKMFLNEFDEYGILLKKSILYLAVMFNN